MLKTYAIGIVALVGMTLAWVAVQGAWRRTFGEDGADPDVLSGRMGCRDCTCTEKTGVCQREAESHPG